MSTSVVAPGSTFPVILSICCLLGFLLGAMLTAGFEWGVELTFGPGTSESTIAGLLNAWAQIGGIMLIYGLEFALGHFDSFVGGMVLVGALGVASGVFTFISGALKRQQHRMGA
mmetsp:Transcript_61021/g.83802  ORF Transcript_61021/g.83802 Transcript_61021/m.83802 type:complete len:114 (-) Transcript_61021:135-476(-)